MTVRKILVPKEKRGERLDRFVGGNVPGFTADRARKLSAQGKITIGGKPAKAERKLWGGEEIEIALDAPHAVPEQTGVVLPVLGETADWMVIDKPAGLVVALMATQRAGAFDVGGIAAPGVVHRLDRETSGCLMLAKTDDGFATLNRFFEEKKIEKRYRALVLGVALEEARIETPYARNPDNARLYTTKVASARRAALSYRRLEQLGAVALLEVHLETGRTHQIRAQLADAGLPLIGDPLYGSKEVREHPAAKALGRLALHAFSLTVDGARVEAPLPEDFQRAIAVLAASDLHHRNPRAD